MNTKQKLFTFTSIGAVFATAIAFVAVTGARNLSELHAGSGESSKLEISNFTKTSLDEWDENKGRAYFTLSGTTAISEEPFVSLDGTYVSAWEQSNVVFGGDEDDYLVKAIDPDDYGYLVGFSVDFYFKGPGVFDEDSSIVETVIKSFNYVGTGAGKHKEYSTETQYLKFDSLYDEDEKLTYVCCSYPGDYNVVEVTIKRVKIAYTC